MPNPATHSSPRDSRRFSSNPKPVGTIFDQVFSALGLDTKLAETRARLLWPDVVGRPLSDVSSAFRVERGKLFVAVSNPSWRNELVFLKAEIIRKINRRLGRSAIKDILFVLERRS